MGWPVCPGPAALTKIAHAPSNWGTGRHKAPPTAPSPREYPVPRHGDMACHLFLPGQCSPPIKAGCLGNKAWNCLGRSSHCLRGWEQGVLCVSCPINWAGGTTGKGWAKVGVPSSWGTRGKEGMPWGNQGSGNWVCPAGVSG